MLFLLVHNNLRDSILPYLLAVGQFEDNAGIFDPDYNVLVAKKTIQDFSYKYLPPNGGREGGENIATAIPIAAIPFNDFGFTCDNLDDYDAACPDASTSPDVVYIYTPAANQIVDINLCGSGYDTKLFVFENSPDVVIDCNEDQYFPLDFCGAYVSAIFNLSLTGGNTYYFVIDGWGGDCGNYNISVVVSPDCSACLPGSTPEGEGDIPDGGIDTYNGGCQSPGNLFSPLVLNQVICGRNNTYVTGGANKRDADWYEITLNEPGTLYVSGYAEYYFRLNIRPRICPGAPLLAQALGEGCELITISKNLPAGTYVIWALPAFLSGMPEGQNYNFVATLNAPYNWEPVADCGEGQLKIVTETVQLDGSGSSDIEGEALTYEWSIVSQPTGSTAVLNDETIVNPTFEADIAGEYNVQLIVNDGTKDSYPCLVTITIQTPQEATQDLIAEVEELVAFGILNQGQGNSLIVKLQHAINKMDQGNYKAAINMLNAFINEVTAFNNAGILSDEQANTLIAAAERIITVLENLLLKQGGVIASDPSIAETIQTWNYPNPLNSSTTIFYSLPSDVFVTLKIYNSIGEEVSVMVNGMQSTGMHNITLYTDGLSSGIYYYRLQAPGYSATKKLIVLK